MNLYSDNIPQFTKGLIRFSNKAKTLTLRERFNSGLLFLEFNIKINLGISRSNLKTKFKTWGFSFCSEDFIISKQVSINVWWNIDGMIDS